jgi:NitT/TauT family transport system permease protein
VRHLDRIFDYTLVTAFESLTGFALAILVGVPLALMVAFSPFLRRTLYPEAVTLEMVPKIALAPVFVTAFGFSIGPKIAMVFLVCFFPILLNGVLAFTSLSVELGRFCLSTGAGPLRTFFRVRLPAALPQLFVGLKGAAVNATVGATISEMLGGDAGLGYYIVIALGDVHADLAFAVIVVLAALGLAIFGAVILAERWLIPWHVSQRAPFQGVARTLTRG